jgi:hypothetical protein
MKKKKKKKSGGSIALILGLVGGGVVLLGCCGCGGVATGVYFWPGGSGLLSRSPDVVGRWEGETEAGFLKIKHTFEFRSNGTGTSEDLLRTQFNYRQIGDKLTITYTGVGDMRAPPGQIRVNNRSSRTFSVRRDGDTLTLEESEFVVTTYKLKKVG